LLNRILIIKQILAYWVSIFEIMKEKDLYVDFKSQEQVYYVEKEDESYGPIISGSYLSKHYLDDFYEKQRKQEQQLREKLKHNLKIYIFSPKLRII